MKTINGKTMFSTKEASAYIGVRESTMRSWRHSGDGPKSFRIGAKLVFYAQDDLDDWLREQYESTVTA